MPEACAGVDSDVGNAAGHFTTCTAAKESTVKEDSPTCSRQQQSYNTLGQRVGEGWGLGCALPT